MISTRRILPILLVASLVLGVLATVPSALANPSVDAATWGAPGAPVQAAPGDTARPLSVSIRNGDQNIYQNVRAQIGAVGPLAPSPGGDTSTLSVTFNPGDVFVAKFFENIGTDAKVGTTYDVPLTLFWTIKGSTFVDQQTLVVPIQLTGRPVLQVAGTPTTLPANTTTDVTLDVANFGDGATGPVTLTVAAAQGSGVSIARADGTRNIGALAPRAQQNTTFTIRTPPSGSPALSVTLSYADSVGAQTTETHVVYFDLATGGSTSAVRQDVGVALAEDHLDSGRPASLDFTVTNGLAAPMSSAVFTLDTGSSTTVQTVGGSDAQALGDLASGASRGVKVDFITTNGATGILKLVAHVTWLDATGATQSQAYDFGIELLGTVDVQLSGVSAQVATSGTAVVTGTLTNLGNALAHNAYVSIVGGGGFAGTDQTFLGDINPNTALPFTLTTTATNATLSNATGAFPGGGFGGNGGGGGFRNGTGGGGGGFRNGTGGFGNGTFGNRTGGRFGGGNQVVFEIQWNDDYGTLHTLLTNATVRARTAGQTAATTSGSSSGRSVPALALPGLALAVGAATALAAMVARRRP